MPKKSKQVTLRLPDGLKDRLVREAALQGRTLNTDLAMRLEKSLDQSDEQKLAEFREYLQEEFADIRRELTKLRELILSRK